jgi:hypothetical protein
MFGMILKFQAFLEKLKQNKRLWFTTLTIVSFLGIAGTLSYLNTMTSRAAKNLYTATSVSYFQDIDVRLTNTFEKISILGVTLLGDQNFVAIMGNQANTAAINERLKKVASEVNAIDKNMIFIDLYNTNGVKIGSSEDNVTLSATPYDSKGLKQAITTNQFASTIEYQDGKVYLAAYFPIQNGILETKKSIDYLIEEYNQKDQVFQVLLDKDFLNMKTVQQFGYKKVGKSEVSVQAKTDDDFLEKINDLDFDELIKNKYILTDKNFILAKPIVDINNKRIGMILISENILKENGLPNMTRSISTGITTAAMGLVVSLLVLMI